MLVYAFDKSYAGKRATCLKLIDDIRERGEKGILSMQVLLELYNVITEYIADPLPPREAASIINDFIEAEGWVKLNYDSTVARKAVGVASSTGIKIWDAVIGETMKENGVYTIVTENEKDFNKIPGIRVINPFK